MLSNGTQSQGDTQPVSQWVYDYYTNNKEVDELGNTSLNSCGPSQNGAGHASLTEHIDLLAGFEQPSAIDTGSAPFTGPEDDDIDPLSQDVRAEIFPESKRFKMPRTPATQGSKRKRGSQGPSDEMQTPSLPVNPFADRMGNHEMLGPSQLFKATQAVTSPLNAILDMPSDRPSPELLRHQRPSTDETHSSPVRLTRSNTVRAATEPQTTYVSMKESQEARERRLQGLEKDLSDESSDGDFDSVGTQLRKHFKKKEIDEATRTQFAGVMARSQPTSGDQVTRRRRPRAIDEAHSSPLRTGRQAIEVVLVSDDPPAEDIAGNITEEETEREEDIEDKSSQDIDELAEENKENVEVPMTVSRLHQATSQPSLSQPTPSHHLPRKSARISRAYQATPATSSPTARLSPERVITSLSSSQAYAIVDSQSSQHGQKTTQQSKVTHEVQKGPSSSLDSRTMILQSQMSQVPKSSTAPSTSDLVQGDLRETRLQASGVHPPGHSRSETIAETKSTHEAKRSSKVSSNATPEQSQPMPRSQRPDDSGQTAKPPDSSTDGHGVASIQDARNQRSATPSRYIPFPRSTSKSTSKARLESDVSGLSNPSTLYETAKERLGDTPSKSRVQSLLHTTRSKTTSPAKSQSQSLRTMQQIAADPSPPDPFGDIELGSILNKEDLEDRILLEGSSPKLPTPKRKRARNGPPLSISSQREQHHQAPRRLPGSPERPPSSAYSNLTQPSQDAENAITNGPHQEVSNIEACSTTSDGATPSGPVVIQPAILGSKHVKPRLPNTLPDPANTANPAPQSLSSRTDAIQTHREAATESVSALAIVASNRVFAHFNGSTSRYYTATCTGIISGGEPRYQVLFDDGAQDTISGYGVKRLELRPGDNCKVEMKGFQTKNFVVMGTQRSAPSIDGDPSSCQQFNMAKGTATGDGTDIFGNSLILVSTKRRQPGNGEDMEEPMAVPLSKVYFTQTMWTAIQDREYLFTPSKQPVLTGLQTPTDRTSTPSTPSSRARRAKSSGLAGARPTNDAAASGGALFDRMVFTLTNITGSEHLERTKATIVAHGGRVLDSGFDDLFNVPCLSLTPSSSVEQSESLHLTASAKSVGFTCLIADRHCRRAKYIQALALGIPCLATRWIPDCISRQTLLPLSPYLLPAGDSTFLNGASRSRVLDPLPDPTNTDLSFIFSHRSRMLADTSILLIMQKHEEQTMRHHNFLTHALGAARVAKALNAEAAAKIVVDAEAKGEHWDWVYTHDKVKETEKAIFGSIGGKRRKQVRGGDRRKTRVVGNEFVIQSLILGQLADV